MFIKTKTKQKKINMGLTKEQLSAIISKTASHCRPDSQAMTMSARENINEGSYGSIPSPDNWDSDAEKWDAMYSDSAAEDYNGVPSISTRDIQYSEAGAARSALPENIKESMIKNRINVDALAGTSVLDTIGVKAKPMTAPTRKRTQITEQTTSGQQVYGNGGVDYSIIKAIVSECIRDYFSKQMLNEGALSSIVLQKGTVSLVDNKGNVFRAKLEKIGNANEKGEE